MLTFCSTVPSGSVANLIGVGVTPTSIELSWGPINERDQNGIIQSYNIYYRLNGSSDPYMTILNVTELVSDGSNYLINV